MSQLIEVVGGIVDADGRTQLERDVAAGLEQLRRRQAAEGDLTSSPAAAPLLVAADGVTPLERPLPTRDEPDGFIWTREPPPEWQARLDRMFPPNDRISWLKIVWVAGDEVLGRGGRVRVDPVQRWVIFQLTRQVPAAALTFLEGKPPHPKHNRIPLMREQWDLYRETGCYAQPFWIVQGERGGHKRRFNKIEQKILKAQQLPTEPPTAGALPYAPFDNRVVDKLAPLDVVRNWCRAIEICERKPEDLDAEEREAEADGRRFLLSWLESQVEAAIDSITPSELVIETDRDTAPIDVDLERERLINQAF